MFRSRSVTEHLLRGLVGFGLLAVALLYSDRLGWFTLAPLAGALVSLRGCPMCWTAGLVDVVFSGKARAACVDGSCASEATPATLASSTPASSTPR